MHIKRIACQLLAMLSVGPLAQAATVVYDINFIGGSAAFGYGTLTFSDTPAGQGLYPGTTAYDFTSVEGSSANREKSWESSFFEYDSTTGACNWEIKIGGNYRGYGSTEPFPVGISPGLSPIEALEANFAMEVSRLEDLEWSRRVGAAAVPDGGSTLALLGLCVAGMGAGRRNRELLGPWVSLK